MKASQILFSLIRNSACLENIGYCDVPDRNIYPWLSAMFGQGTVEMWGAIQPHNRYLYTYGYEFDDFDDVVTLAAPHAETVTMVLVD